MKMDGDAVQTGKRSDVRARHHGSKQAAVDMQQPAKVGSDGERLAGGFSKE